MTLQNAVQQIPVEQLHFDSRNPRLTEFSIGPDADDAEIMSWLWEVMDVQELAMSIAAGGYFQYEPIIVSDEDGRYVVIDGNRRLAAARALLRPEEAGERSGSLPEISPELRDSLRQLPAVMSTREDTWRSWAFKHINGQAKWSGYAKARYIAQVHQTYQIPLREISRQIGDRHKTVQRLYRGLMVLEQAEREKVYNREYRFYQRFAFSHLYAGLDYEGISGFLALQDEAAESDSPVPESKIGELGELCVWLYGDRRDGRRPVIRSQNPDLRRLSEALEKPESLAALRANVDLPTAVEISRPTPAVFEEALSAARRELQRARAHLTGGYGGSETLLRTAGTVANLADDLYDEMLRKSNPAKQPRLTERQ